MADLSCSAQSLKAATHSTNSMSWIRILCVLFMLRDCLHHVRASRSALHSTQPSSVVLSAVTYDDIKVGPYNWKYFRVELPLGFSLVSFQWRKKWDMVEVQRNRTEERAPLVCFRFGGPPVPTPGLGSLMMAAIAAGRIQNFSDMGKCASFHESVQFNLTDLQVLSGVFYVGVFSDSNPTRTQSQMISRGKIFPFELQLEVVGCEAPLIGQFCDLDLSRLGSQGLPANYGKDSVLTRPLNGSWLSLSSQCGKSGDWTLYALQVTDTASKLEFRLDSNSTSCLESYVRYGALPYNTTGSYVLHDAVPLSIDSPKTGWWYVGIFAANASESSKVGNVSTQCCYSIKWRLQTCEGRKVGAGCAWNLTSLERVLEKKEESPFDSYYRPIGSAALMTKSRRWFSYPLVPAVVTADAKLTPEAWAYFYLKLPQGTAGSVLSLNVITPAVVPVLVVARFEGLPTSDLWDFRVASSQLQGANSLFSKKSESMSMNLDLVYPAEGAWYIGVQSSIMSTTEKNDMFNISGPEIKMRLQLHGCVGDCSGHGVCKTQYDESRLHFYSYCYCDRAHGGLDCSVEVLARGGQALHIFTLIASNIAALLPSVWSLQQKAYSEWIVYTTSGLSSGVYHSCDAGGWCALSYDTLQFLDFWLSFLAVVITFLFMAAHVGSSKAAMHISAAIFTAMIAHKNATSATNIVVVMCIGAAGLLVGLALETGSLERVSSISTRWRSLQSARCFRWQTVRFRLKASVDMLQERFRWQYIVFGVVGLVVSFLSLIFETGQTYWIWHSLWHVSIYSSAFCFLRSRIYGKGMEAQLDETNPVMCGDYSPRTVHRRLQNERRGGSEEELVELTQVADVNE